MCTERDIGFELLDRWQAAGQTVCAGSPWIPPWRSSAQPLSSITVHRIWQHNHSGEDAFYTVRNLYVDPRTRVRVTASPTGGPRLAIPRGSFRVACRRSPQWSAAPAPLTLASIKRRLSFGALPHSAALSDTSTLFVSRDGAANIFHSMADVVNAFLTRHMFPYEQIVFLDDHADGPLTPLWSALSARPILRFHELPGPCVLRSAAFAPPGGCCFLWKNYHAARAECARPSPLLQAFRRSMLDALGLEPRAGPPQRVTVIRRRVKPGARSATRRIANEGELLSALQTACGGVEVQAVDFAELPYIEQIRTALESGVLVGMHGAGLTNLLWLQPSAAVVELFPPGWQPACFGNLAAWLGVRYCPLPAATLPTRPGESGQHTEELTVDISAVVSSVRTSLEPQPAP